jgi:7-cyano-7-deazaguanine synthase
MKALVVLSGGQDSTTCLALAVDRHGASNVAAVTFNYGQRHAIELKAARDVALLFGVTQHEVCDIGPILKGTSPLTDPKQELETYESFESMDKIIGDRVEKTFVPMRNALFLTLAANRAVCLGVDEIWTGVCQADNANYPDCRAQFITAQERTINEALGRARPDGYKIGDGYIDIITPLMASTKAQSIRALCIMRDHNFAALAFTHTAYDGNYPPTSQDHANTLRAQGFLEAGMPDPLVVRAWMEGLMALPATDNYRDTAYSRQLIEIISSLKAKLAAHDPQRWLDVV